MREIGTSFDADLERVRDAYQKAAEQLGREQHALGTLHKILVDFSEENLRFHQHNLAILEQMKRDVKRLQRQMRRLSTAKA
ncbi:MAG: hypothetical protein KAX44_09155 [Candidatus Brocadiae bacterium]|nr:hypothetical protein [Candidatus Brocadiia bacterium]